MYGSSYQRYQLISTSGCSPLLFLALIALRQYANKLARLLTGHSWGQQKFMTGRDENIADVLWMEHDYA